MIKASKLDQGDTIGIVSPSWGGAGLFPHRVEQGVRHFGSLGFKVKIARHALNHRGFVSDIPENRAQDIHDMFMDPEVKAIVAAIGGDHSCHLLPLLDFRLVQNNPKIFMGHSDITVLNLALWQKTGLVTFNGPALLTDFGEYPRMLEYTEEYFLKAVADADPVGRIEPSPFWTKDFQDWERKQDLERPRKLQPSEGWAWLKHGRSEGRLIGGCLESMQHLRSTEYWPDLSDAILFIETSEDKPTPETADGILMDYQNMGVLGELQGLIVGRPIGYSPEENRRLRERILERTQQYSYPIITDMDFGHTAPQFTLPIGCRARIDTYEQTFEIIEAAVN